MTTKEAASVQHHLPDDLLPIADVLSAATPWPADHDPRRVAAVAVTDSTTVLCRAADAVGTTLAVHVIDGPASCDDAVVGAASCAVDVVLPVHDLAAARSSDAGSAVCWLASCGLLRRVAVGVTPGPSVAVSATVTHSLALPHLRTPPDCITAAPDGHACVAVVHGTLYVWRPHVETDAVTLDVRTPAAPLMDPTSRVAFAGSMHQLWGVASRELWRARLPSPAVCGPSGAVVAETAAGVRHRLLPAEVLTDVATAAPGLVAVATSHRVWLLNAVDPGGPMAEWLTPTARLCAAVPHASTHVLLAAPRSFALDGVLHVCSFRLDHAAVGRPAATDPLSQALSAHGCATRMRVAVHPPHTLAVMPHAATDLARFAGCATVVCDPRRPRVAVAAAATDGATTTWWLTSTATPGKWQLRHVRVVPQPGVATAATDAAATAPSSVPRSDAVAAALRNVCAAMGVPTPAPLPSRLQSGIVVAAPSPFASTPLPRSSAAGVPPDGAKRQRLAVMPPTMPRVWRQTVDWMQRSWPWLRSSNARRATVLRAASAAALEPVLPFNRRPPRPVDMRPTRRHAVELLRGLVAVQDRADAAAARTHAAVCRKSAPALGSGVCGGRPIHAVARRLRAHAAAPFATYSMVAAAARLPSSPVQSVVLPSPPACCTLDRPCGRAWCVTPFTHLLVPTDRGSDPECGVPALPPMRADDGGGAGAGAGAGPGPGAGDGDVSGTQATVGCGSSLFDQLTMLSQQAAASPWDAATPVKPEPGPTPRLSPTPSDGPSTTVVALAPVSQPLFSALKSDWAP